MNASQIREIIKQKRDYYALCERQGGDQMLVDMVSQRRQALDEILLLINNRNTPIQSDPLDEDESI